MSIAHQGALLTLHHSSLSPLQHLHYLSNSGGHHPPGPPEARRAALHQAEALHHVQVKTPLVVLLLDSLLVLMVIYLLDSLVVLLLDSGGLFARISSHMATILSC